MHPLDYAPALLRELSRVHKHLEEVPLNDPERVLLKLWSPELDLFIRELS